MVSTNKVVRKRDDSFSSNLSYKVHLITTLFLLNTMSCVYNVYQAVIYLIFYFPSHFLVSQKDTLLYLYRTCQYSLAVTFSGFIVVLLEMKSGMKPIFYGDSFVNPTRPIDSAIFMSNHTSYADWVVLYSAAFRHGISGAIRFFLKDLARYLPGIGWACYLHEFFLVSKSSTKGNWSKDGDTIVSRLKSFKASGNPIWPTIFPEGTFHDGAVPDLVEKTQAFAKEKNLPHLDYLLTPRTRGFLSCVENLDSHITHIVDQTIAFTGQADPHCDLVFDSCKPLSDTTRVLPDAVDLCSFRGPKHVHLHVRITPISELPTDEEGIKNWLHTRWQEKDELLKYFQKNQKFPGKMYRKDLTLFGEDMMIKYVLFWLFSAFVLFYLLCSLPSWFLWNMLIFFAVLGISGVLVQHFYKDK